MANLEIRTLGNIEIRSGGEIIDGFRSRKVVALLVYLAAHPKPQPRETLAELLWEESSQSQSLANLRVVITDLRRQLGEWLDISREKIGLRRDESLWIDYDAFNTCLENQHLDEAVELYRGEFLKGFFAPDTVKYDLWMTIERESVRKQVTAAYQNLVEQHRLNGEYKIALNYAQRRVELDYFNDDAQTDLIRLLALTGQRNEALIRFNAYRAKVRDELKTEPGPEINAAVSQIQSVSFFTGGSDVKTRPTAVELPKMKVDSALEEISFAGRRGELAFLQTNLRQARMGHGGMVLISGDSGSGKTVLLGEFAHRVKEMDPGCVVVSTTCASIPGARAPYLPFVDIFSQLINGGGQPEISEITQNALLECGRDLVGSLIPARQVLTALGAAFSGWQKELAELASRKIFHKENEQLLDTGKLVEQYAGVLSGVAFARPLVVCIDDLQWADPASINLLRYLARRILNRRILIVGACHLERNTTSASLPALDDIFRLYGENQVDLNTENRAAEQGLIDALIDVHPNRLEPGFRENLSKHTAGNAFFTVELLRHLQEFGYIGKDVQGCWVEQEDIQWENLPAKVETIIASRCAQLDPLTREALEFASIAGDDFSVEMTARVVNCDAADLTRRFNSGAALKNRLIQDLGSRQHGARQVSMYRFRHEIIQRHFLTGLNETARPLLHERFAAILEEFYMNRPEELEANSARLAWHFKQAGCVEKSIKYLTAAGSYAVGLGAKDEAAEYYRQGMSLLPQFADIGFQSAQKMALGLSGCASVRSNSGIASLVEQALNRPVDFSPIKTGLKPNQGPELDIFKSFQHSPQDRAAAFNLARDVVRVGDQAYDPCLVCMAHWALGMEMSMRGDFQQARIHLEQVIDTFDPVKYAWIVDFFGNDPALAALGRLAWVEWFLGYPDQARQHSQEALALAERSQNPLERGMIIGKAGVLFNQMTGNIAEARRLNALSRDYTKKARLSMLVPSETISAGWIMTQSGAVNEGVAWMRQGLEAWDKSGSTMHLPQFQAMYASGLLKARQIEQGLEAVKRGLDAAENNREAYYEAELYRLQGELQLFQLNEVKAEKSFKIAVETARAQEAKSLELRATLNLCQLWKDQGKDELALVRLQKVADWFTEGADTPDLVAARKFIDRELPEIGLEEESSSLVLPL